MPNYWPWICVSESVIKIFYDDNLDCNEQITDHCLSFYLYWQSREQCILSFYVFKVITLQTGALPT